AFPVRPESGALPGGGDRPDLERIRLLRGGDPFGRSVDPVRTMGSGSDSRYGLSDLVAAHRDSAGRPYRCATVVEYRDRATEVDVAGFGDPARRCAARGSDRRCPDLQVPHPLSAGGVVLLGRGDV